MNNPEIIRMCILGHIAEGPKTMLCQKQLGKYPCSAGLYDYISIASLVEFLKEESQKDIYIEYGVNGIDSILNWLNQQTEGTHD